MLPNGRPDERNAHQSAGGGQGTPRSACSTRLDADMTPEHSADGSGRRIGVHLVAVGAVVAAAAIGSQYLGASSLVAIAVASLTLIASLGWVLWWTDPNRRHAVGNLGVGLLVGVVVAAAVGGTQLAIESHRQDAERLRQRRADRAAETRDLRVTVGLQRNLQRIDLRGQDLSGFYLAGKDLRGAQLCEANLRGANFYLTNLAAANLANASLMHALIFRANLADADLANADLRSAVLVASDLHGANLQDADLGEVDGRDVNLQGASLDRANLRGASLSGANLRGVSFHNADLRDVRLYEASYDASTMWPASFRLAGTGAREVRPAMHPGDPTAGSVGC